MCAARRAGASAATVPTASNTAAVPVKIANPAGGTPPSTARTARARHDGQRQAHHQARRDQQQGIAQHHPQNAAQPRAQGDAHADLARPLRGTVGIRRTSDGKVGRC
jgi:hypothetical protein